MASRLQEEIGQTKPFAGLEEMAYVNLQRTASFLVHGVAEVLKPSGLTPTQYNVLRILRGAKTPLTCGQVGERMINRDPDVTRILDRLEAEGLVRRERSDEDRRVVVTEITPEGLELVDGLDESITRLHDEQLGHMGEKKLRTLNALLEEARKVVS